MDLPLSVKYKGWTVRYRLDKPASLSNDSETFTSPTASSAGTSAHKLTETVGQATDLTTLVFVHGTPWSSVVYKSLTETLVSQDRYQILVYDLPGYGQSQVYRPQSPGTSVSRKGFEGDTSVRFQAEFLAFLLSHLNLASPQQSTKQPQITPAIIGEDSNAESDSRDVSPRHKLKIVAHDIAGTIVLRTHLIHKIAFDAIFLADTNAVLPWGDGFYTSVRRQPAPFVDMSPKIFEAILRAVVQSACFDPRRLKAGWEDDLVQPWLDRTHTDGASPDAKNRGGEKRDRKQEVDDGYDRNDDDDDDARVRQTSFVRQIAQANDDDVAAMLDEKMYARVTCPVKIVWGQADQWIPREKMVRLVELLEGRADGFTEIPGAGHLVMIDQPERFAWEIFEWLQS